MAHQITNQSKEYNMPIPNNEDGMLELSAVDSAKQSVDSLSKVPTMGLTKSNSKSQKDKFIRLKIPLINLEGFLVLKTMFYFLE